MQFQSVLYIIATIFAIIVAPKKIDKKLGKEEKVKKAIIIIKKEGHCGEIREWCSYN